MGQGSSALPKQLVQIGLTGGVNVKQDKHQLANGQLLTADNVIFSAVEGQVTKRYGYNAVTPQGAPFQGGPFKAIGCRDNIEPIVFGQNTLNRYNIAQNLSTSVSCPTLGRLESTPVTSSSGQALHPQVPLHAHCAADNNGQYTCVVWEESNGQNSLMYYGVQDQTTGAWIIPPSTITPIGSVSASIGTPGNGTYNLSGAGMPTVRYYDGYFYIAYIFNGTWVSGATTYYAVNLCFQALALTNLAAGPSPLPYTINLANQAPNGSLVETPQSCLDFDISSTGKFIAAWYWSPWTSNIIFTFLGTASGGSLTQTAQSSLTLPSASSYYGNGYNGLRIAVNAQGPADTPFAVSTAVCVFTMAPNGGNTGYALTDTYQLQYFQRCPVDVIWYQGNVYWTSYGFQSCVYMYVTGANNTLTQLISPEISGITAPVGSYFFEQISRLFVLPNGHLAFWAGSGANSSDKVYNTTYLIEVLPAVVPPFSYCIARTNYLCNPKLQMGDKTTPVEVFTPKGTQQFTTFLSAATELAGNAQESSWRAYGTLNRVFFDASPARQVQVLSLPTGGNLIAGAYPMYYDGNTLAEAGFSASAEFGAPQFASVFGVGAGQPNASTSGGSMAAAAYTYYAVFVRRDAYGNTYRSAPSGPYTVTTTSSTSAVFFRQMDYTGGGNVQVEFYRNTPTLAGQGTWYFVGTGTPITFMMQTAPMVSFQDTLPDSSIISARTLNMAETPNDPPPPIYHMAVGDQRAYLIPADNRNVVWCSKQYTAGRTVEWSAQQYVTEGQNSSLFTGVAVLDSNVIVFKANSIGFFSGSGPDNTGANGYFTPIQSIASDVGCVDPASIAALPAGIVFRSRRGIELLTRGLTLQYIGAPIEPIIQNPSYGLLSSVVVMPNFDEVRFIPATPGQPVLVFDYGKNRWSTFGLGASGQSSWASVQAVKINNDYWWVSADGSTVNIETPGAYLDNGQPITMTLETAEIPIGGGGSQGWGRLYRMALLGDFYSSHTLTIFFQYDHQSAYTDAVAFSTSLGLISGDTVYQFRCSRVPRQRMQTVRLKIQDSNTSGQSCAISTLVLETADKGGLARLPGVKSL